MPMLPDVTGAWDLHLELPIGGRVYRVPPVTAGVWARLWAQRLDSAATRARVAAESAGVDPDEAARAAVLGRDVPGAIARAGRRALEPVETHEVLTGPVLADMIEHGVPAPVVEHAALVATFWALDGPDAAGAVWVAGPDGIAAARGRAAQQDTAGGEDGPGEAVRPGPVPGLTDSGTPPTPTTSGAEGTTTPSPGPGSGTSPETSDPTPPVREGEMAG